MQPLDYRKVLSSSYYFSTTIDMVSPRMSLALQSLSPQRSAGARGSDSDSSPGLDLDLDFENWSERDSDHGSGHGSDHSSDHSSGHGSGHGSGPQPDSGSGSIVLAGSPATFFHLCSHPLSLVRAAFLFLHNSRAHQESPLSSVHRCFWSRCGCYGQQYFRS